MSIQKKSERGEGLASYLRKNVSERERERERKREKRPNERVLLTVESSIVKNTKIIIPGSSNGEGSRWKCFWGAADQQRLCPL